MRIDIIRRPDFDTLGIEWRGLEATMPWRPFFRSWTWVGCLAAERFPDAVLLRAEVDGRLAGLALFNLADGRLCLGESGDPVRDAPFVEHNGPLVLADPRLTAALLQAAAGLPGVRRLVLGGVPADVLAAAPGVTLRCQERQAPFIDLAVIRAAGGDHLQGLSANTRQQIRRSHRHYARSGELRLHRAGTEEEAQAMLARLIALHEASWKARGKPGAFAHPWVRRFHAELVRRAQPRDELDLLELRAGAETVGVLYNFRAGDRAYAYQSGFAPADTPHAKPGMSCHALAIARGVQNGDAVYDFLGGADRYKQSLANRSEALFWAEQVPRWSALGLAARARQWLRTHAPATRRPGRGAAGPDSAT
ncbi:GNAT family N-acetyltransferase [Falsiroseomonas sp. HC035]|uniref:GNAT family N-acetyltransferase n=1 Tax=Falsiroseomonas sp. HC035 TaxID=3390999 RepID=UPI003D312404